jgi:hypothetical protein
MVIVKLMIPAPPELMARITGLAVNALVGVPLITPVVVFSDNPGGNQLDL